MARNYVDAAGIETDFPEAHAVLAEGMREIGTTLDDALEERFWLRAYVHGGELYLESHDEHTLSVWRNDTFEELNFDDRPE